MDCHDEREHEEFALAPRPDLRQNSDAHTERNAVHRGSWASQIDYLLSVIGYSVSLTNVLRFPYICSKNGGGAFLIPYILCLTFCGLPLFFLEVAIGQFCGKSGTKVWSVCPLMKGLGIGMMVISGVGAASYTIHCAWTLYYAASSCRTVLPWTHCGNAWNSEHCVQSIKLSTAWTNSTLSSDNKTTDWAGIGWNSSRQRFTASEEFWHFRYKVLSISSGLDQLGSVKWELVLCLLVSWLLIFGCIFKGVRSVGKVVYVTATLPYIFLSILLVRGLTLPGGPDGALFYLTPDFSKLLDIQVWLEACAQVFFSLGPAWGGILTLASYNNFNANCLRNAVICTLVCGGTSLFAGLVVFSVLGFMAQEADVPITAVATSGPGLGFVVYPEALAQLPVPQLWSFLFFIMLILLILDSLFSMVETVISGIMDEYPFLLKWRTQVNLGYCIGSFLIGIIFTTEGGMYLYQLEDWYIATLFIIFAGFLECITLGWIYGVNRLSADIELMIGRPAPWFFKVTWRYITPTMLLIVFISTLMKYAPPTYGSYVYPEYAATIGWTIASISCVPFVVMMFVAIYREEGTIVQRFKRSLKPSITWGPAKSSPRELYHA
ncbi:sodium- and chloride-dependent glycine transporter 1-like [Haliotis rufescens]|uniref:sodium- and chloride-dependent glycine transporter 1-like n=1 Tax=Haliotis rufescens TaxID=6454 RepID=UPI00201F77D5|nr:sodium- and chloride-dependent glycine transporter 1-like [Haliotis rufescens]